MIRDNIIKYVKEHGIKQEYIANGIQISSNAVSSIMNGKRDISAEEYVAICKLFNVSCDFFATDEQIA